MVSQPQDNATGNRTSTQATVSIRNMPIKIWNLAHAKSREKGITLKQYIIDLIVKDCCYECTDNEQ